MPRVDNEILHNQMNWRYNCKKFDTTKKIREADWNILIETLRLSVSGYGLQPWKFFVVQSPGIRKQLQSYSSEQNPVTEASHFIVVTYKEKIDEAHIEKFVLQFSKIRDVAISTLDDFKNSLITNFVKNPQTEALGWWAQKQTYMAMGSFLTTAALMEIDVLLVEGLDLAGYDQVLKLENSGFKTVAAIACGYRSAEDPFQYSKKVRFDSDDVIVYK